MQNIGISNDIVKNLKHEIYTKQGFLVVDDLFTLGLKECMESELQFCIVCEDMIISDDTKKLVEYYDQHCPCYSVSQKTFTCFASKQNCAGLLLVTKLKENKIKLTTNSTILVCDGLENSGNIGTIFRTADASKIDLIIFVNVRAKINDIKVIRASRGTIFTVPFICLDDTSKCVDFLEKENARIIICEPEQGISYHKFDYSKKIAIVVGNERFGINKIWFDIPNVEYIKIPMQSNVGSLNVGVATSIVLYEAQINKKVIG